MFKKLPLILLLLVSGLCLAWEEKNLPVEVLLKNAGFSVPAKKQKAPNFTAVYLDGKKVSLNDLQGRIVLLNFWATWCPPCREEMPSLQRLYAQLQPAGLEMLAVNLREKPDAVAAFRQKGRYTFPLALDESGKAARAYNVQAIPATFIIDREGYIAASLMGGREWDDAKIVAALQELLNAGR